MYPRDAISRERSDKVALPISDGIKEKRECEILKEKVISLEKEVSDLYEESNKCKDKITAQSSSYVSSLSECHEDLRKTSQQVRDLQLELDEQRRDVDRKKREIEKSGVLISESILLAEDRERLIR